VFEGRLAELAESIHDLRIEAVLAPLPRPNQAFWTLSALWAGWLWGREALGHFKSVLRRRRYDWAWHSTALHAVLENLHPVLVEGTPVLGLVGENEPGFLTAALVAAEAAGFKLDSLAMRPDSGQAQIVWRTTSVPKNEIASSSSDKVRLFAESAREHLRERGEPAAYLTMQATALSSAIAADALDLTPSIADVVSDVNNSLDSAFSYRRGFVRYGGSEKSLDIGQWWLERTGEISISLADRVEMETVKQLLEYPGLTLREIDTRLCQEFPGLMTPSAELMHVCIESYGESSGAEGYRWMIRKHDVPEARRADLIEMHAAFEQLLNRMDYKSMGERPILVYDVEGELQYVIYVIASAVISELIFSCPYPAEKSLVVLPGGRANLVAYKLQHDPRLRQAVDAGWRFMKYRQIRMLLQAPRLTKSSLADQFTQDSLTYDAPQLRLF
jgi:hypothetical protein